METVIDQASDDSDDSSTLDLSRGDDTHKVKLLTKEILDRIGYGLSSQQFLNILFVQSGASLFLVGMINGLKVMFSVIVAFLLDKYRVARRVNTLIMSLAGILFGLSVFLMTMALVWRQVFLFAAAFLVGSVIAVFYGSLYQDWFREHLALKNRGFFLSNISYYGLAISGISMILAAYVVDRATDGQRIAFAILGHVVKLQGFVVVFLASAILFMFAAVLLLLMGDRKPAAYRDQADTMLITSETWQHFISSKVLIVLLLSSSIISLVQTLATAYYGIFIYENFKNTGYGGFMNVAIIFLIAMLTSIVGPMIAQFNARAYGKVPMLVFGTMLLAIGPITFYANPNLLSISVAMFLSTIGSAICGVAFGLLTVELVREDLKQSYTALANLLTLVPYAIFIPIGALIAQTFGMELLFLILALVLVFVVVPMYVVVVSVYSGRSQKI